MSTHPASVQSGTAVLDRTNASQAAASGRRNAIARIDVIDTLEAAEPAWRSFDGALATPYQRYEWTAEWQRHVGARQGLTPFIVIGRDASNEPVFLWPLGRRRMGPLRVAQYLGGKHANFNMPLWRRERAAGITAADMQSIVARIPGVDMLMLLNQPECWQGERNPLTLLPHQPSPSQAYRGALAADFEALFREKSSSATRKKLRKKERALSEHGALRCWRAETPDDVHRILDIFFAQKSQRMRELGVSDIFGEPGVREFITAACLTGIASSRPPIDLYALAAGETIVATYAGAVGQGRFCGMFNSMIRNELAQQSPGDVLLINLVRMCCERGLDTFDLGIGEAAYKDSFCSEVEALFDSFLPVTALGSAGALVLRTAYSAKRQIKNSDRMWRAAQTVRRRLIAMRG